jgi:D-3-phosphoglycerate dehydrogenase
MKKLAILIRTRSFASIDYLESELNKLAASKIHIENYANSFSDVPQDIKEGVIGIIAGVETYDSQTLISYCNLMVISRVGVGQNSIDSEFAESKNISITLTEDSPPTEAVAQFALLCILDGLRSLSSNSEKTKQKTWTSFMGRELSEVCVGVIGFGRIGRRLAEILTFFGARVIICDPVAQNSKFQFVTLSSLFMESDVVSIHVPLKKDNISLINLELLKTLKDNAILINTSRGGIIDELDLQQVLNEKSLKVYLDVFQQEPYNGPLLESSHVFPTSHIAGRTLSNRIKMEREAVDNLVAELRKRGF